MNQMPQALPVLAKERFGILDVLRGFALLGVMIDNLFGFTGWGFMTNEQRQSLPTWPADGLIALLEQVFVSGKFYSLFSLLFGVGFSIIIIRNEQKGINPLRIFYRRLFVLMLFGVAHTLLLWEGDILFLYAIIGMALPLFRKLSNKSLLAMAVAMVLSPLLLDAIAILLQVKFGSALEQLGKAIDAKNGVPLDAGQYSQYLYPNDGSGWHEWRNWQASGWAYRYSYILETNRIPKVLGMFLLGFYAGRKMMYTQLEIYVPLFRKLRFWGLLVGIPAGVASFYFEFFQEGIPDPIGLLHSFFYAISVVPLSLAYTAMICLYWIKHNGSGRLKIFAPMGRMALTNYIMQTVFGILLYYGVGLGLGGHTGPSVFIPLGILVYVVQMVYSYWWFRYYNFGPLEWIWRQLTYGKRLLLRKAV